MTHIVSPARYPTKKAFKTAVEANPKGVYLDDPSVFGSLLWQCYDRYAGEGLCDSDKPSQAVMVRPHRVHKRASQSSLIRLEASK